jgi:hypothetical protein
MKRRATVLAQLAVALVVAGAAACSVKVKSNLGSGSTGDTASGAGGTGGGSSLTSGFDPVGSGGAGGAGDACNVSPNDDNDKDGWTGNEGDCNDCDPNVNPGAVEVLTDPKDPKAKPSDENCDMKVDEKTPPCDTGLNLADIDPAKGAASIGLCKTLKQGQKGWGILKSQYTRADGSPSMAPGKAVGLLTKFGANVKPREGASMLGLSSGYARDESAGMDACNDQSCKHSGKGQAPQGFPQDVPNCSGSQEINDDIALDLEIKAPSNATGYSFDFNFFSFEYPEWVCTSFNDQFIALVSPPPKGSINGNISFDTKKNPVSVNIAFFQVCDNCPLGTNEMAGTGFNVWDDAGATSWLTTQAPIKGGETFKIRFAIWDTGDQAWDSTVLVDNFKWIATPGKTVSVNTVPTPK